MPFGHVSTQEVPLRKFGSEQLRQVVSEFQQVAQGALQFLHVLSVMSPHSPEGQVSMHEFKLRKYGFEQLVQVVGLLVQFSHAESQFKFLQIFSGVISVVPPGHLSTQV